ncbi:hypothetical protein GCM10009091_02150 [Pseudomonas brenneri]|nr:hypothetical protein GCM10009091_02150 [Pseudomonas brenneri]
MLIAVRRQATGAVAALTTEAQGQDDLVTHLYMADIRSDVLDDTGTFMTEHNGHRDRDLLVTYGEVGVADAGGDDFDPDFAAAWCVQLQLAQVKQWAFAFGNGSQDSHGVFSLQRQWLDTGYRSNQSLKPD